METKIINIHLNEASELFGEPDSDPFDPDSRYISGIDEITERLHQIKPSLRREQHILVSLPGEAITPPTHDQIRAAMQRYCDAKIAESQRELAKTRRRGPRALAYSLAILIIGMIVAMVVYNLEFLPDYARSLFSSGFTIFAWVALWEPAGIYLYEWIPLVRDKRLFQLVKGLEISIEASQSQD
jgi:hypothetical protein